MTQTGIDEAGRGPVLGSMVLAGLKVQKSELKLLTKLGVQDSKLFGSTPKGKEQRAKLCEILMRDFETSYVSFSPTEVDQAVRETSLNKLEQKGARQIIKTLAAEETILDGKNLFRPLENALVTALNKADLEYPVVAGASIIAKTKRDLELTRDLSPFLADFGEIRGGGYPNAQTLKFVLWHQQQWGKLPDFYRKSYNWKALKLA
ncbi:MAG: hypothetical protein QNL04_03250 [SAR324 cluster bacterium]|nr:hypothetical protein [SAR324 cluster bacterium]